MISEMKAANALGARTARACDSCLLRRARWFCSADDAFLCHACDILVHSANQLARRHERVRLQTASSKLSSSVTPNKLTAQSWHSGFTRKARTPRHNKHLLGQQHKHDEQQEDEHLLWNSSHSVLPVVPELASEEPVLEETEEQLLCRVPVLDPFDAGICSLYSEVGDDRLDTTTMKEETCDLDNLSEFFQSDMDLAEFAGDVESLLGSGLDEDSEVKDSELFNCKEEEDVGIYLGGREENTMVKVKDEQVEAVPTCYHLDSIVDMEGLSWNIESESLDDVLHEKDKAVVPVAAKDGNGVDKLGTKRKIFLRLNYEDVISAWESQGSPWTTGNPPHQFISSDCWPHCLGSSGAEVQQCYGEVGSLRGHLDVGREARVSRYREKRRTRLFAKKIRYEVRKLNAEKRPRMKGRFVKRSSFVGTSTCFSLPLTSTT